MPFCLSIYSISVMLTLIQVLIFVWNVERLPTTPVIRVPTPCVKGAKNNLIFYMFLDAKASAKSALKG